MTKKVVNKYKVDVLAFGPHPDDIEFGCGGTLAKLAKHGKKVAIIDMSLAENSTNGDVVTRLKEAQKAGKILGAAFRENLELPNNFFKNTKRNHDKIVRIIRKYQPELVLLPYFFDRHPDHENGSKMIREALFSTGLVKYKTGQPKHRPSRVLFYMLWNEDKPSFVVDITDEFETKMQSILAYKSQFELDKSKKRVYTIDNDDRMLKYVESRARNYGFVINRTFGEAFLSINPIGINSPFDTIENFF